MNRRNFLIASGLGSLLTGTAIAAGEQVEPALQKLVDYIDTGHESTSSHKQITRLGETTTPLQKVGLCAAGGIAVAGAIALAEHMDEKAGNQHRPEPNSP